MASTISLRAREAVIAAYEVHGVVTLAHRDASRVLPEDLRVSLSSARRIVREAIAANTITLAGAALRRQALDAIGRMLLSVAETAYTRAISDDWCGAYKVDPAPNYIRSLTNIRKSILHAERLSAERDGEISSNNVIITVVGPDGTATEG